MGTHCATGSRHVRASALALAALLISVSACSGDDDVTSGNGTPDATSDVVSGDAGGAGGQAEGGGGAPVIDAAREASSEGGGAAPPDASSDVAADRSSDAPIDALVDGAPGDATTSEAGATTCSADAAQGANSTCATYCDCMQASCGTFDNKFASRGACISACQAYGEAKLCCRAYHCSLAATNGANGIHCEHAVGTASSSPPEACK